MLQSHKQISRFVSYSRTSARELFNFQALGSVGFDDGLTNT